MIPQADRLKYQPITNIIQASNLKTSPSSPSWVAHCSSNMKPQVNYWELVYPVVVVGPQFITQSQIDLTIVRKVLALSDGNFMVADANGNVMFKVKAKFLSIRDRRVLLDADNKPVLSLQKKLLTSHRRWNVYRGEGSEPKDLLFSAKLSSIDLPFSATLSSMFQTPTSLDIFLASNVKEEVCDFKVKGRWWERSFTVYAGDSDKILAHMQKKVGVQSLLLGRDKFEVTVYPNTDYAFIVALILILDGSDSQDLLAS